jgi:HK97 family phage major capsid protein
MNIGTAADGGNAVPTGFYNQIIARRDESMLSARLPIMRVPGVGTTVDVPLDGEADGEFVATAEAGTMDLDAPAIGKKSLTLAKYTKRMLLSYELLEDTPTAIESFLADFVGRGMAKTHNSLLLTEVATNGTLLKTFAATAAIAFGEPEDIVGNNDLAAYMDDDAAIAWVMRNSTKWDINSLVGDARQYSANGDNANTLLGYPVYTSQKAAAPAADAKSVYFGNWSYVAMREAPGITFQRDPYSNADTGQLTLRWWFRTVYGVLQAEAIGYAAQAGA